VTAKPGRGNPCVPRRKAATGCILGLLLSTVFFETFGIAATSATKAGPIISLTIVMTRILETVVASGSSAGCSTWPR
jgi:uncharacterized membrane protein YgaE (UPF0421/DUF939 family)